MEKELITLSKKEIERLRILHMVIDRSMTQVDASQLLGITDRQVRNLIGKIRVYGDKGIAHGNRGRQSPHKMSEQREDQIVQIIKEKYPGFRPTFAREKLREQEGIRISYEKLRRIMISKGLWRPQLRKDKKIYQWRERKQYLGEMVQMDGSHHDWLEDRGPRLVLMGYIDDATSRFFGCFYDYEGVYPAMDSFKQYIELYGLPLSLYLDKHSTYKTTRQPQTDELLRGHRARTQFERAVKDLGTRVIHAHSPQAKGRIERVFATLQDRLVKEMRLVGISTKEQANRFLIEYLPKFNEQFTKTPKKQKDLHRQLPKEIDLSEVFCIKGNRTINDGYIIKWKGRIFLLDHASIALKKRRVIVREHFDRKITIQFNNRYLEFHEVFEPKPARTQLQKEPVNKDGNKKGKYIPPPDHPWKRHNPALHHNWYLKRI